MIRRVPSTSTRAPAPSSHRAGLFTLAILCLNTVLAHATLAQEIPEVTATLELSHANPYQYQSFTLTLTLRSTGVNLSRRLDLRGLPDAALVERITPFREMPMTREQTDGRITELRQYRCEARAPGVGTVAFSPTLALTLIRRRPAFIGSYEEHTPYEVALAPCRIDVRPLPPPPADAVFSGAVGVFRFEVAPAPTTLAVGDILNLTITLVGDGYLRDVRPPRASPERHFRSYDPRLIEQTEDRLVFQQTLVPQSTNATAVPAVSICTFDPIAGRYDTLRRGPFPLTFHEATQTTFTQFRPAETNHADPATAAQPPAAPGPGFVLRRFDGERRCAQVTQDAAAYLAPATTSLQTFTVPRGATVAILATHGDWARIDADGKRGWIVIPR